MMEERIKRVSSPSSSFSMKNCRRRENLDRFMERNSLLVLIMMDEYRATISSRNPILASIHPSPSSFEYGKRDFVSFRSVSFRFALPRFDLTRSRIRNFPRFRFTPERNNPSCAAAGSLMLRDRQRSFGLIVYPKARPASVPFL